MTMRADVQLPILFEHLTLVLPAAIPVRALVIWVAGSEIGRFVRGAFTPVAERDFAVQ